MATHSLPIREITIEPDHMLELQEDSWSHVFQPVQFNMNGKSMEASFGYRGGHTRNYFKKSYEVRTKSGLTLHWNAEFDDPSMIRNALSFQFFNQIGVPSPHTRHILLVINGVSQGVYLEIESVDPRFFRKRGISCRSIIYAVNDSANFSLIDPITERRKASLFDGYELVTGPALAQLRLIRFVGGLNRKRNTRLQWNTWTAKRLDVNQYLLWLAGAVLTGNYDGFDQNYALYEHAKTDKFRIIPWDYEGTWGRNCYGKPCGSGLVRIEGYNTLTRKLLAIPAYKRKYRSILIRLLQTAFTEEQVERNVKALYSKLTPAIQEDYTRKSSFNTYLSEPAFILNYVKEKRLIVKDALKNWKHTEKAASVAGLKVKIH
ncbi:spore coat protein H [Paenibacillus algorifonticola]|uniref:Spore coat protein H n=1 Tax=Paenibacillus algorifonticola TaxID=684063 RepID=A0A1I2G5U1_9BACL|nr:CotH kinase family protein [Paenibacillus algorifonticola]SFF12493.1 spore coat protein H [Paenibacillus algorifonticola]